MTTTIIVMQDYPTTIFMDRLRIGFYAFIARTKYYSIRFVFVANLYCPTKIEIGSKGH
jgi:hypothetical protein